MSKTAKWILGIVIGLIVLAALATAGFLIVTNWNGAGWMMEQRALRDPDEDGRLWRWGNMPMHRFDGPFGMHGSRFFGFSFLGWILGGLQRLGFLVLIVAGIVALVRGVWRSGPAAVVTVPPTQTVQPPATYTPTTTGNCPNCGFPVQAGWKHCPNCAHNLGE